MDTLECMESLRDIWHNSLLPLDEKIREISRLFYGKGLDLNTTAAFINATPFELDALLALGSLDEEVLSRIAALNPPKTTWVYLGNANDAELEAALLALETAALRDQSIYGSEFVYNAMKKVAGDTLYERIEKMPRNYIWHAYKMGEKYNKLTESEAKYLNQLTGTKQISRPLSELTEKQIKWLANILLGLIDKGVLKRNSIDENQSLTDDILDIFER
jgi:hypothetical protein